MQIDKLETLMPMNSPVSFVGWSVDNNGEVIGVRLKLPSGKRLAIGVRSALTRHEAPLKLALVK
jgi:hypothetical protein